MDCSVRKRIVTEVLLGALTQLSKRKAPAPAPFSWSQDEFAYGLAQTAAVVIGKHNEVCKPFAMRGVEDRRLQVRARGAMLARFSEGPSLNFRIAQRVSLLSATRAKLHVNEATSRGAYHYRA